MKLLIYAVLLIGSPAFSQEGKLIAVLSSNAPAKERVDACRDLARVGTRRAVPALAALLTDEQLSDMARYALERIADPSVDSALRGALRKARGSALVGVIDSLGVRKDRNAIAPLASYLSGADGVAAQAAARALGSIGTPAAPALLRALSVGPSTNRLAVCEGLLRCAETMRGPDATAIYDRMRAMKGLPPQAHLAATLGAIRSRGVKGEPLLLRTMRFEPYAVAAAALQLSADMPGARFTRALTRQLGSLDQDRRALVLRTLGSRGDPAAVPALVQIARKGPANLRVAAIRALVQIASPSSLPVLVALVKDPDTNVSSAALAGLVGFRGTQVDTAVIPLLDDPDPRIRAAGISVAAQRSIAAAVPALLRAAGSTNSEASGTGFRALAELARAADIPALVDLLLHARDVAAAETALSAVCARQSNAATCSGSLLTGLARAHGDSRLALLRILGAVGGPQALAAVRAAAADSDDVVRRTALRVLCDWQDVEALPDLDRIARTTADRGTKILALRGQLRLIPMQNAPVATKVVQLKGVLALAERREEQVLALAALAELPSGESLALVEPFLTGGAATEEAALAAVTIAEKIAATQPAAVAEAMSLVRTSNAQLADRAERMLAATMRDAADQGFTSLFNGRDLSGWDGKPGWWKVEDGALTAESTPEKPCKACNYLIWRGGKPADFELLADFKLSRSANSGIQIRSEERPDWDTFGYQADMTGDGELVGFVYHHSRGLIAGRGERAVFAADGAKTAERIGDPAELAKRFKQGDWNTYRVVCRGPQITLYVNGALMCDITDHHASQAASRGIIALQMHPGPPMKVQFRNIRLRELK